MTIGILKEAEGENRVAVLAADAAILVKGNSKVIVETGAGESAFISDTMYTEAGAETGTRDQVLGCDLVIGINPPSEEDIKKIPSGKAIIGLFSPLTNSETVQLMQSQGLTCLSLESVPRTTRAQAMDVLSSMATVAGYKAVLAAATHLPSFFPMFMTAAGTVKPAKVLILGAGVAGLQAIATARKLGSVVEAFDVRAAAKEEVLSLGAKFVEVEGAKDDSDAGGYAVEQSEEFKKKQQELIQEHSIKSDVIITTAQIPGRKSPILVTRETVDKMRPGSVIIDLAAAGGGNCEVTKNNEIVVHNGVTIIGDSNLPSDMPRDASQMFSKNIMNLLKLLINEEGAWNVDLEDDILAGGTVITHNKEIINERVKEAMTQTA